MYRHLFCSVKVFCIAALFLLPSSASAQGRGRIADRSAAVARQYDELLRHYADSLYRDSVTVRQQGDSGELAPLFLPFTYYRHVAHKAFSLGQALSPIDRHLLNMYLSHPDLVRHTQSELEKTGPTLAPKTVTEKPAVLDDKPQAAEPEPVPVDVVVLKPNFWTFRGDYYLQFLQNYVSSNWYKGGESNYSMVGAVTLEANYNNKQKVKWDNKLEMKLGFQTSRSDSLHKLKTSQDLLRYTGKLGLQASKKWYYTLQLLAYTQFMRNYKTNQRAILSDFGSPLTVNLSLGMDYTVDWLNHRLQGTVHLAPVAYNFKYVDRLELSAHNGLEEGRHTLHDLGSQFTLELKWQFTDNILWQTRLYGYTTYKRGELEWENTFSFQFNKYVSTKLFVYPRFDDGVARDGHHGYWQFQEYVSLGFSYSF
jgi:hypothetical protein